MHEWDFSIVKSSNSATMFYLLKTFIFVILLYTLTCNWHIPILQFLILFQSTSPFIKGIYFSFVILPKHISLSKSIGFIFVIYCWRHETHPTETSSDIITKKRHALVGHFASYKQSWLLTGPPWMLCCTLNSWSFLPRFSFN